MRVRVLQSHGVEVHTAKDLCGARFLWQPNVYDLILLDVRRHLPGEALDFYEQITTASPKEHFAFLVGPVLRKNLVRVTNARLSVQSVVFLFSTVRTIW